jgi:Phage integrase family
MADRLARELDRWSQRTLYGSDDDLVFAHPQSGRPLDRTKLTRRFKAACIEAGVRAVRFHDLRDPFATRLAASCQPMRTIQELNAAFAEETVSADGEPVACSLRRTAEDTCSGIARPPKIPVALSPDDGRYLWRYCSTGEG